MASLTVAKALSPATYVSDQVARTTAGATPVRRVPARTDGQIRRLRLALTEPHDGVVDHLGRPGRHEPAALQRSVDAHTALTPDLA